MQMQYLVLAFVFLGGAAEATPDFESRRINANVSYEDGASVAVECDREDRCDLTITADQRQWRVEHEDMGGVFVLPSHLALVGNRADERRFVVQVEVGCSEYAANLPAFLCLGQLTIEDGRLTETLFFKRTFSDDRDDVPVLIVNE